MVGGIGGGYQETRVASHAQLRGINKLCWNSNEKEGKVHQRQCRHIPTITTVHDNSMVMGVDQKSVFPPGSSSLLQPPPDSAACH
ncbi:hypothetical protein Nepgr_009708 [Nepenthes gracilis]|uniref:Uncharacterized protein n=1 Tax=Nepenthes gracilis TaxID=150966 RepID=A0AAD3SB12_NEPGR|nr:hypothetical protein Nepgr_009708 [Nepenthes gracilis]